MISIESALCRTRRIHGLLLNSFFNFLNISVSGGSIVSVLFEVGVESRAVQ